VSHASWSVNYAQVNAGDETSRVSSVVWLISAHPMRELDDPGNSYTYSSPIFVSRFSLRFAISRERIHYFTRAAKSEFGKLRDTILVNATINSRSPSLRSRHPFPSIYKTLLPLSFPFVSFSAQLSLVVEYFFLIYPALCKNASFD